MTLEREQLTADDPSFDRRKIRTGLALTRRVNTRFLTTSIFCFIAGYISMKYNQGSLKEEIDGTQTPFRRDASPIV